MLRLNSGKPSNANLRRATSNAYYAMFHTLARTAANLLVGGQNAARSRGAWRQVYRGFDHHQAKIACSFKNKQSRAVLKLFPNSIQDFADAFVTLQEKRHSADYDPYAKFTKSDAKSDIALARQAIAGFNAASKKDRLAFCVHAAFKARQ